MSSAIPPETPMLVLGLVMVTAVVAVLRLIAGEFERSVALQKLRVRALKLKEQQRAELVERLRRHNKAADAPADASGHDGLEAENGASGEADNPLTFECQGETANAPMTTAHQAQAA